jgi:D-lyxose ketol-isomerase
MKRSEINTALNASKIFFEKNKWAILPHFRWDVTDFGLGKFNENGLVLINLAEENEYCEKLMYAKKNQRTPAHYHKKKKEDIICRIGTLTIQLWDKGISTKTDTDFDIKINGQVRKLHSGDIVHLQAGERITIHQGIWHEFWPETAECIIGEVSAANDDLHDNFFRDPNIGRYPNIEEDEPALIKLLSD